MPDHENRPVCVVLGGGGHARVVIDCIILHNEITLHGIVDADESLHGTKIYGVPVLGPDTLLPELIKAGVNCFVVGVGSVGDVRIRKKLFEYGLSQGIQPHTIIHPRAIVSANAKIGPGSMILAGAILNAGASIGQNVIVNTGAIIEHDCTIADHVHIATGAVLSGTVTVGEGAHIGAGATIRQNITIGVGAVVGIGAAVVKDVPPNATVVGVPACPLRN